MTQTERKVAYALNRCRFLPGSFEKKFVHQLDNWEDKEMTTKGRDCMLKMLDKFRNQIPNYLELRKELTDGKKENK